MLKLIKIALYSSLIFVPAYAKDKHSSSKKMDHAHHDSKKPHEHGAKILKTSKEKITIKVNGMVCAFCAQGIEKNMGKREEVQSTQVDLEKMLVEIKFKKGKSLSEKIIKEIITDAGFKFVGVKN